MNLAARYKANCRWEWQLDGQHGSWGHSPGERHNMSFLHTAHRVSLRWELSFPSEGEKGIGLAQRGSTKLLRKQTSVKCKETHKTRELPKQCLSLTEVSSHPWRFLKRGWWFLIKDKRKPAMSRRLNQSPLVSLLSLLQKWKEKLNSTKRKTATSYWHMELAGEKVSSIASKFSNPGKEMQLVKLTPMWKLNDGPLLFLIRKYPY